MPPDDLDGEFVSTECPVCHGAGYNRDDYRGTYPCDMCGSVGRLYLVELPSALTGKTPTEEHNEWDALRTIAHKP